MKKEYFITILLLTGIWYFGAFIVHNDILIPFPHEVFVKSLSILVNSKYYQAILATIFRVTKGFLLSLVLALVCSILANEKPFIARLFAPIFLITKTIPNISYIIICLIWFGSEGAVSVVTFMILFPVFYTAFKNSLDMEEQHLKDVDVLYSSSFVEKIVHRLLPSLILTILTTSKTAFSLGFKVGIMAEILGQIRYGIGKQLYYAKINLDTTSLLAWTLIIIFISLMIEYLFNQLITLRLKEEQIWKD